MQDSSPSSGTSGSVDVAYVAHLARIALSPEEKSMFQEQLEHILDHVRTLNELDVTGIDPMAHAIPVKNRFREDVPAACLDHDGVVGNAPAERNGQFFVPRILE